GGGARAGGGMGGGGCVGEAAGRRARLHSHDLALARRRRLERLERLGWLGWPRLGRLRRLGRLERLATTQRLLAVRVSLLLRFAHSRRRRLLSLRLARILAAMAMAARR